MKNLGSATGSETGYKHTVKGYESPPAKKRAMVDENGITVVGYESPRELVGIVKVEPKEKGQGKKRGAAAGAGGRVPRAEKRAKKVDEMDGGAASRKRGVSSPSNGSSRKRAKCTHGREKYRCKECGGSGICVHGREKQQCKECGGSGLCVHGREKRKCKECGGSALCPHGRQKSKCKECGGSGLCPHGREKRQCKECGGSGRVGAEWTSDYEST